LGAALLLALTASPAGATLTIGQVQPAAGTPDTCGPAPGP
jgi:hypothetical protein